MKVGSQGEQYATGYLAVKYLHKELRMQVDQADGVIAHDHLDENATRYITGCFKQWY